MNILTSTYFEQITMNPALFVVLSAAIALLIWSGHRLATSGSPAISVNAASVVAVAASGTFAILTSLQAIVAAPLT